MKIEIFGTGCDKCTKLYKVANEAANSLGIEYDIQKVNEVMDIVAAGVVMTPALGIDGDVKVAGRVPDIEEMKEILR